MSMKTHAYNGDTLVKVHVNKVLPDGRVKITYNDGLGKITDFVSKNRLQYLSKEEFRDIIFR